MPYSDPDRARDYQRDYCRLRRADDESTTPAFLSYTIKDLQCLLFSALSDHVTRRYFRILTALCQSARPVSGSISAINHNTRAMAVF